VQLTRDSGRPLPAQRQRTRQERVRVRGAVGRQPDPRLLRQDAPIRHAVLSDDPGRWGERGGRAGVAELWRGDGVEADMSCRVALKLRRLVVLLAIAGFVLGSSGSARATSQLSWQKVGRIATGGLSGVSCPSVSLCVAVDNAGNVLSTTHPTSGASAWPVAHVDGMHRLAGIACPSGSLCVAVDDVGNVLTSTDPAGGARAWTVTYVDDASNLSENKFSGVACPTVSLCVAVDVEGNAVTSTDPVGGARAWTVTHVDDGLNYDCWKYGGTGPGCQAPLVAVSCPAVSLCVAVDDSENVISSSNPTGGALAWSGGALPGAGHPPPDSFYGLSCPSASLCVAVDFAEYVETWNPSLGGYVRKSALVSSNAFVGVSCRSDSLCLAFDTAGNLYASSDPAGTASAWTIAYVDRTGADSGVTGVSCPSASSCIAVGAAGNVLLGSPPPTRAQLRALLYRQLLPSGHTARIGVLLRHGGYSLSFIAPTAGRVVISWYLVPTGDRLAAHRPKPVLIATVSGRFATLGAAKLTLKLTRTGNQLLTAANHLKLTAKGSFTPTGRSTVTASRTFTLNR
jgi:hypothetical protein